MRRLTARRFAGAGLVAALAALTVAERPTTAPAEPTAVAIVTAAILSRLALEGLILAGAVDVGLRIAGTEPRLLGAVLDGPRRLTGTVAANIEAVVLFASPSPSSSLRVTGCG